MVKNLKKKKGFTLIELIIVIAILGILAAIAIPKFGTVQNDSKKKSDVSSAKQISNVTEMLLTQEKISAPTSSTANLDTTVIAVDSSSPGSQIVASLQSTPKPQYNSTSMTKFYVIVDENGGVKVVVAGDTAPTTTGTSATAYTITGGTEVYPTPAATYK